jgi:putative addiction module CopG family antidote
LNHLTPALSPTKYCGGEGEPISAPVKNIHQNVSGSKLRFDNGSGQGQILSMNVSLPVPLQEFVQRKIAEGDYRTADEVVCEALRLLQHQEDWNSSAGEAIETGWRQASEGQLRTPEEVRESLALRKESWKQQQGK